MKEFLISSNIFAIDPTGFTNFLPTEPNNGLYDYLVNEILDNIMTGGGDFDLQIYEASAIDASDVELETGVSEVDD